MGVLGSASITYTVKNQRNMGNSRKQNRVSLAFGDGSNTYPTGGITIISGNCGCPNTIESMVIADQGTSGYTINYNATTGKLQLYTGATHNHPLYLHNADVSDGATTRVNAGTNLLGANTGASIVVAGVTSTTATSGGIVTAGPALDLAELASTVAPAALTLICEVIGW